MLQAYQAYTDSHIPSKGLDAHITYHVAQASKAKHRLLVDGGLMVA